MAFVWARHCCRSRPACSTAARRYNGSLVFPAPALTTLSVQDGGRFPVRRIYCVGRNYWDHGVEMGGDPSREPPFFFHKPTDAAVDCSSGAMTVPFPSQTDNLAWEGELVMAVGKEGRNVSKGEAASFIWGYAAGVDLTRRDLQDLAKSTRRPWCTSKGFDCSGPVGSLVRSEHFGITGKSLQLKVNGECKQQSPLEAMIWKPEEIIVYLSSFHLLCPGDLIFTGTPAGVGRLKRGDRVECIVDGLPGCEFDLR